MYKYNVPEYLMDAIIKRADETNVRPHILIKETLEKEFIIK